MTVSFSLSRSNFNISRAFSDVFTGFGVTLGDLARDNERMLKLLVRMLLELRGYIHIFSALQNLRINHVGNDRLIFARKILVQELCQLFARDALFSHTELPGCRGFHPEMNLVTVILTILDPAASRSWFASLSPFPLRN